ncbi:MAG: phosphotransferase, partial [Candidatus Dormiibacterota bacterium]
MLREYIAIPTAHMPTCYVEDTPPALRYFFSQLLALPKGGALLSAVFGVAKRASRVIPYSWLGALAPVRIIVGRVAARPGEGFETRCEATLLDATGMHSVVLALSKDPNAKLTVLLIPHGDSHPALAVKVPATAAAEASIAAERRVLTELRTSLSEEVLHTIPAVSDLPESQGRKALVTTALPGVPMTTRYHAWRHLASPAAVRADFATVEGWLVQFQGAAGGEATPIDMDGGTAGVLARRFARDAQLGEALRSLGAVYSRLRLSLTPKTAVHGDFWFGNVLLSGDEVT